MENRLKERLTGAAILVALIVLVVPELFRGPQPSVPTAHPTNAATDVGAGAVAVSAGPPPHSYAIDLSGQPSSANSTSAPKSASAPSTASRTDSSARSLGSTDSAAPSPPTHPNARPLASTNERAKAKAHTGIAEHSAAHAVDAVQPSDHAHLADAARTTAWSVQLGLFAKENNAERMAHAAEATGFMAHVVRAGSKGLYRVVITNVADRDAAEQVSRRLHAAGLPGAIVGPR